MEDVRRNREIETDGSGVRTERAVSSEPQVFYPEILTTTTSLLADKNIQKYTEVPVVFIKTEFDSKDTIIKKELDVEHGHFQQKPSMDTFLHIKQENSIIKTEVDTDEVIVKLELETSPTVLQPRTRPCSQLSPADVPTQMPSPTPCRGTVSDDPAAIAAPYPGPMGVHDPDACKHALDWCSRRRAVRDRRIPSGDVFGRRGPLDIGTHNAKILSRHGLCNTVMIHRNFPDSIINMACRQKGLLFSCLCMQQRIDKPLYSTQGNHIIFS